MARKSRLLPALAALGLGVALVSTSGCGDSKPSGGNACTPPGEMPDNLAGDYVVGLVNGANTCPVTDSPWMDGATTEGVEFVITQKGVCIEAETMGPPAIAFLLLTGANQFTGAIHGSHFVLTNYGTKTHTYGTCTYMLNAVVEGDLDGDTIAGTLTYKPIIDENPDCDDYDCAAEQAFSGSRP